MSNNRDKTDNLSLSDEMNAKGIEFADRGWLDEAARYFRKAIALDAGSGHAWDNLASVLAEKGEFREALTAYLKSIELEPDVAAAHYNLAAFLTARGLEMAEAELRETLALDPELPDAQLSLGLVYADMGRLEDAIAALEGAIAMDPDDAYPRHELAVLLMDEGDVRGAIGQLREVVRLEADNADAWIDLGVAYMRKGFYAEAERALSEAGTLHEGDVHVLYSLASLYALWDRADTALEFLGKAISADRDHVLAWLAGDPAFEALRGTEAFDALLPDDA